MMRRRDVLLGMAAAVAAGWGAVAQEAPKSARIGFIVTGELWPRRHFDEAMQRLGWAEGRNLTVERRVTGEDPERRKTAAAELVATNPDVIVAAGTLDAQTVLAMTRTIPIVVIRGQDQYRRPPLLRSLSESLENIVRPSARSEAPCSSPFPRTPTGTPTGRPWSSGSRSGSIAAGVPTPTSSAAHPRALRRGLPPRWRSPNTGALLRMADGASYHFDEVRSWLVAASSRTPAYAGNVVIMIPGQERAPGLSCSASRPSKGA